MLTREGEKKNTLTCGEGGGGGEDNNRKKKKKETNRRYVAIEKTEQIWIPRKRQMIKKKKTIYVAVNTAEQTTSIKRFFDTLKQKTESRKKKQNRKTCQ